jgi:uncharacterized repeat protein (TIGR02543 family)
MEELLGENFTEMEESSIWRMGDFHLLSDSEIDQFVQSSDLADVGYYLNRLSASDREELLERDTILSQKTSFCRTCVSGDSLEKTDTLKLTEKEECLYYQKCLLEYEEEADQLGTSAAYRNRTGYFYLSFVDETGSGLSATYAVYVRVCPEKNALDGSSDSNGMASNRKIRTNGKKQQSICVWMSCISASDNGIELSWRQQDGAYAVFQSDENGEEGRVFIPYLYVRNWPAYTLMYTKAMDHTEEAGCSGRGNFYAYSMSETEPDYTGEAEQLSLRKYNMQADEVEQKLEVQIDTSHMGLPVTTGTSASTDAHCTMYIYINQPSVTLTVDPNGEKWNGKQEVSTLQVVNLKSYELGTPAVTNYKAVFYGEGDEADPVDDITCTIGKTFDHWELNWEADGTGEHQTQHSYVDGTTFWAGNMEYDQGSENEPTTGEAVTAAAVYSGGGTITFPEAPVRNGYTFAGWYTTDSDGTETLACSSAEAGIRTVQVSSDVAFHAKWLKNEYTVSFYNGEELLLSRDYPYRLELDLSSSEQVQTAEGNCYLQTLPEEESLCVENGSYVLVGWSLSKDGPVVSAIGVPADSMTCLYAVWSRPTSGMKHVLAAVQSGENRNRIVIGTEGIAVINLTLGLKAFFYQAYIPVWIAEQGVEITADSYAEDHAGNKTPLLPGAAAVSFPVQYTFQYRFYVYDAETDCWNYLENKDTREQKEINVGDSYDYCFDETHFCEIPSGYSFHHAEYRNEVVQLPYMLSVVGKEADEETVRLLDVYYYPVTCTLTFDANGGTFPGEALGDRFQLSEDGTIAVREVLYGSCIGSFPGAQNGLFYGCTGFYTERSGGTAFRMNDTVSGNLILYAQWEAKELTVRFDAAENGGSMEGNAYADAVVQYGDEIPYWDYTAERENYEFLGWSYGAQNISAEDGVEVLQASLDTVRLTSASATLYAQFARTIHVSFHQYGYVESGVQPDGRETILYNREESVAVKAPSIQPCGDWESLGWSTGTDASAAYELGAGTAIYAEDDRDYYAIYRRQVTLTYDYGLLSEEADFRTGEADTAEAYRCSGGGEDLAAEFVIREGPVLEYYTLAYWKGSDGVQYAPGDSVWTVSDITLTAVWEPVTVTVVYDARTNGGTIQGKEYECVNVGYGSWIASDMDTYTAVKDGYEFLGWNTDPDATIGFAAELYVDEDIIHENVLTLYAVFKKDVYARFHQQGEQESVSIKGTFYNRETSVVVHAPGIQDYEEWIPLGWTNDTASAASVTLCPEADFELWQDMDFYALYKKEITLTYHTGIQSMEIASAHGYTYHNTCKSTEEADDPVCFVIAEMTEPENRSFLCWKDEEDAEYLPGEQLKLWEDGTLYASWDEYPQITALDRYFTLEQAVDGACLNEAVLLNADYVAAEDAEDGILTVKLEGFFENEFRSLTGSADLMIFFEASDSYGHTVVSSAVIHITDTGVKENPVTAFPRFLSADNYMQGDAYRSEREGGLCSTSLWRLDEEMAAYLEMAMQNLGAEECRTRYDSCFTGTEVQNIRNTLLEEESFGKYKSAEALGEFIEKYIKKNPENPGSHDSSD